MKKIKQFLSRFIHEEDGAEMVEWAIIIAVAAVIAVAVMVLANTAKAKVEDANNMLNDFNWDSSGSGSAGGASISSGVGGTGTVAP